MDPQPQPAIPQATIPEAPIEDVNKGTEAYLLKNDTGYIIAYAVLVVVLVIGVFAVHLDVQLLFVPFVIGIIGYGHVQARIKRQFTQQFGASIGFAYSPIAGLDTVSGKLFKTGHSQSIFDILVGTHDGLPMRIFTLRFIIGYGKNSQTYNYTVFEATINNPVPDIILFSNAHRGAISDWLSGDETIELEGDFNKYFKLRVPKGYEQEAYQIFTPDVMADLIDKARDMSFEFSGTHLYIYATKMVTKREELDAMFAMVTFVDGLFRKNADGVDMISRTQLKEPPRTNLTPAVG